MAGRLSWVRGCTGERSSGEVVGRSSGSRRLVPFALLALLLTTSACDTARSSGPPQPDFAGTWDVAFEDGLDVELQSDEQTLRGRIDGDRGTLEFALPGGEKVALAIDCASPDIDCPSEVLAREVKLESSAPGTLDAEGVQLAKPLAGTGRGACVAGPGSFLTAEVLSGSPRPGGVRPEALALTSGRASLIIDAKCFSADAPIANDLRVVVSSGFTAAKR